MILDGSWLHSKFFHFSLLKRQYIQENLISIIQESTKVIRDMQTRLVLYYFPRILEMFANLSDLGAPI